MILQSSICGGRYLYCRREEKHTEQSLTIRLRIVSTAEYVWTTPRPTGRVFQPVLNLCQSPPKPLKQWLRGIFHFYFRFLENPSETLNCNIVAAPQTRINKGFAAKLQYFSIFKMTRLEFIMHFLQIHKSAAVQLHNSRFYYVICIC